MEVSCVHLDVSLLEGGYDVFEVLESDYLEVVDEDVGGLRERTGAAPCPDTALRSFSTSASGDSSLVIGSGIDELEIVDFRLRLSEGFLIASVS